MEELILKFPHLSEEIFDCLDNETMFDCKEVSKIWCDYVSEQKFYHIRMIRLTVEKFHELGKAWENVFRKSTTDTIMKLRLAAEKFYQKQDKLIFSEGLTPIHVAAATGNLSLLETIQERAKEKYPEDIEGCTPLHYAVQNGHMNICKALIENMSNKNPKAEGFVCRGTTPLHSAARCGHFDIFKLIENEIEDRNPKNLDKMTPLHNAAASGHLKMVKYIMKGLKDKNPQDIHGWTPLHFAAQHGHFNVVKVIMDDLQNKNPATFGYCCTTPLHLAAENGHLNIVKCIMAVIVDKNPANPDSYTPLHAAAKSGHLEICELILKHTSNKAPKWRGKSPFDLAVKNNHSLVCQLWPVQRCNCGGNFGAASAMLGQNLPPLVGIGLRAKATENLGATAVAPAAPAVTSLPVSTRKKRRTYSYSN